MTAFHWIIAAVAVQRLAELVYARRNSAGLLARGGVDHGAGHYPLIMALHAAWLAALIVMVPVDAAVRWPVIALYGVVQVARYWTLVALGANWTTRIIVVPGEATVRRGPYRFVRHPNYWVVACELALLPLAVGAWQIALLISALNGVLLRHRIRVEDTALGRRTGI